MANKNEIRITIKSGGQSGFDSFNIHHKVRKAVDWAIEHFQLNPKPARDYVAYLQASPRNIQLQLDGSFADQQVKEGSTIIVAPPESPDG